MLRFLVLFPIFLAAGFALVLGSMLRPLVTAFTRGLVEISALSIRILGGTAAAHQVTLQNPVNGFAVEVLDGCNGNNVMVLLWAAILAYPASWRNKAKGLAAGTAILQGVNLVRIITLFYLGQHERQWFEFAHLYVWESLFVLFTLTIFWVWVRRSSAGNSSGKIFGMQRFLPLLICSALAAVPASAQVKITPSSEKVSIEINRRPFTDFYIAGPQVAKPYLWPLRAATGTYVTRMWPMEKVEEEAHIARPDHPHQRGLWFAHSLVNGFDFWNIAPLDQRPYNLPDRGKIVLAKLGAVKSGKRQGTIAATFNWVDHSGKTLLTESRTMTFYADPSLRIVDFDILLTAVERVTFGDEKDGVFGLRLRPVLQEKGGSGHITNADGLVGEKQAWGKRSNWCDYSGEINGEKVGIAILDNPGNPGHPVRWHVRGYGLFAANPFGNAAFTGNPADHRDTTLEPGRTLRFRYRLIIHPGDVKTADIAGQWAKYSAAK